MKRFMALFIAVVMIMPILAACAPKKNVGDHQDDRLRLSNFVGVWADDEKTVYYRFTPTSRWFCYNDGGEVESRGSVVFDGKTFSMTDEDGIQSKLYANDATTISDENGVFFYRTDSPTSLISSSGYEQYFDRWYEDSNLNGNVLCISEPDTWTLTDSDKNVLSEGVFYAYADENESLYLYDKDDGEYFATVSATENGIRMKRYRSDRVMISDYATMENSKVRTFYFKEKGIEIDYYLGDGERLLRNGGAAFDETHDYKKMPVTCQIQTSRDEITSDGQRQVEVVVTYIFKRSDMPYLSGSRIYNTVRFSQYDYYTGELFHLDDSTGTEQISSVWSTQHDDKTYTVQCDFSSYWDYPNSEDVMVRWNGTYRLTMPSDYDGFVICLRPVFNSYSAQVSASISPEEGTLVLEDLGDDVDKSIFCRVGKMDDAAVITH